MPQDPQEIEVEVVEVDGVVPTMPGPRNEAAPHAEPQGGWQDWRQWQGRVTRLDSRWWPLWVLLGIVAAALVLTVGVVFGAIYLILRTVTHLVRAVLR